MVAREAAKARRRYCAVAGCPHWTGYDTLTRHYGSTRVTIICRLHWRCLTKAERHVWNRIARFHRKAGIAGSDRGHRIFSALIRRAGLGPVRSDDWASAVEKALVDL